MILPDYATPTLRKRIGRLVEEVCGLIRVSTPKQEKKYGAFGSRDLQRNSILAFADVQKSSGWRLDEENIIDDPAEQGDAADRPSINKLLERARRRLFRILLVYAQDRLSRKWAYLEPLVQELEDLGIVIYTTTGRRISVVIPHLRSETRREAMRSEEELETIRYRSSASSAGAAASGKWRGSYAPLGFKKKWDKQKNCRLIVDRVLGPIIREILGRIAKGEAAGSILADLKARGVRTPSLIRKKGRRRVEVGRRFFTLQHLEDITDCPLSTGHTYISDFQPERTQTLKEPVEVLADGTALFKGDHPAIVTLNEWKAARQAWLAREKIERNPSNADPAGRSLLQGIARCGCGATLSPTHKGRGHMFCLSTKTNGRIDPSCCELRSISLPLAEAAVIEILKGIAADPALVEAMVTESRHRAACKTDRSRVERIRAQIERHSTAVDRLIHLTRSVKSESARLNIAAEIDEHHSEITELQSQLSEALRRSPQAPTTRRSLASAVAKVLDEDFALVDRAKLKELLRELIEKVTFTFVRNTEEGRVIKVRVKSKVPLSAGRDRGETLEFQFVDRGRHGARFRTPFVRDIATNTCDVPSDEPLDHPLVRMEEYRKQTKAMTQRAFALSINKTEAHVSQYLALASIDPSVRRKILKTRLNIRGLFSLNCLLKIAKLPTPTLQMLEVDSFITLQNRVAGADAGAN